MIKETKQNKILIVGFVLIVLVAIWALTQPFVGGLMNKKDNSEEKINAEILRAPSITSENLFSKFKNKDKMFIIDMRLASDFEKGHITAAEDISAEKINGDSLKSAGADKTSDIILLNQGDDIYEMAKKTNELIAAGFSNAKYLQDGMNAWKNQGFPLISSSISDENANKIKKMSISELAQDLGLGGDIDQFLDTRGKEDFAKGHIAGALNVPFAGLEKNRDGISKVKKVIICGTSEDEAKKAAVTLFDLNFFNAYVLDGGLDAWKNAGGKLE
jgi:rhodanese-related sulfurtransferase